jgi:chain length determinant protein tyrosine kinase EpsG
MAKFRDPEPERVTTIVEAEAGPALSPSAATGAGDDLAVHDRSIGDIIRELRNLSVAQVESILAYQRQHGVRFGEAAVALKLVTPDDVLFALSQQFHYPYAPESQRKANPELVALNQPFSAQAEAFRALRSQVVMRVWNEQPRGPVAIISADRGDGRTFFAANLAVTLAQLGGGRTLLVDADLRGPRQHQMFKLDNRSGLSGILSGRSDKDPIQPVLNVPGLFVLTAGTTPPNPLELVERPAFSLLLRELAAKFDQVVVDTPAAGLGADASVIAARCGAALIMARKDESRVRSLQDLMASMTGTSARVAGVVVNEY